MLDQSQRYVISTKEDYFFCIKEISQRCMISTIMNHKANLTLFFFFANGTNIYRLSAKMKEKSFTHVITKYLNNNLIE